MDVCFLLLLVCLCTLSSPPPVLGLQRDASTLDTAAVEFVRQRSSHGSHSQGDSRHEGLIAIHHSERIHMQSSTNGMSMRTRLLLSLGDRQILEIKSQSDKEEPKNKVHKEVTTSTSSEKGSSADTNQQDDTGHNKAKLGNKEKDMTSPTPPPSTPPPVKPEDKQPVGGKESPVTIPVPKSENPEDQVKENTPRDPKPNAPSVDCEGGHCEGIKKMVSACLRIPGDGAHKFSLFIINEGDSEVQVNVVAPEYLVTDPPKVSVSKGQSKTIQFLMDSKYEPSMLDPEAVTNKTLIVTIDDSKCEITVPLEHLRSSVPERKPQFSSYLPVVTPRVAAYLVALVLVVALVGAWLCYKCCRKKRSGDVKYQQLEMIVPGQSTPKERVEQSTGAWDEVWDDDWEDAEAAKSSSRLSQNLSSRGLGARRGNKDGWDSSWED